MSTPAQTLQADRLRFPGMLPREILILRAWLRLYEDKYDRFDYNVRVGKGRDPGDAWPQEMRDMWIKNTQLRLDAVAYRGDSPTIIEVREKATTSTAGQLLMYKHLFMQTFPTSPEPSLLMVTTNMSPDVASYLPVAGIAYVILPVDFSSLAGKP